MFKLYRVITLHLLAFLSVLCSSAVPAQSSVPKPVEEPVELRLWAAIGWGIPAKDAVDPRERSRRAVFDRFMQLNPDIKIVRANGIQIQGPASESNLLLAFAGGNAPDVFYVNFRKLDSFVRQGFLYPLDEYIKQDPEIMDRVSPKIKEVITVNGHTYSVPFMQYVMALYYRKDLFKAAGLDPNKPPRDWDEFYEYAQKLTIPEKGQYGFGFYDTPQGKAWHWTNFVWQGGGDVIATDKNGKYKAVLNSPGGVRALEFFRKLTVDPWKRNGKTIKGVTLCSTTLAQEIVQGKIAMFYNYGSDLMTNMSDLNPNLLGVAPLPAGPTGIRANEINAGMWGMNSQIKDKRKRDAAWRYIKFMCGEEAERIRTKSLVEAGLWKMVNPDLLERYGYSEYVSGVSKEWLEANKEAFKHGRPEPHGENCEMIYTKLDEPLSEIRLYPKRDPMAILTKCANDINNKMLGYNKSDDMKNKRSIAWVIVVGMVLLVGGVTTRQVRLVARTAVDDSADSQVAARNTVKTQMVAWIFMLPAVLSVLVWAYYPLMRGLVMAFQEYRVLGDSKFVGLDNFIDVMSQGTFWVALKVSFMYVILNLGLGFFVPIMLALMLAEVPRGKMLFRTLFYLPAVTSGLVIMFLWKWFYDPSPQGLFNTLIGFLHIPQQTWLQDPKLALLCVILPGIWAGAGPGSIIYIAALKGIPDEMYEAADVDGAGIWTKIWKITLPTLKPLIIINFVGAFIGSFKAMESVFVMTGGGPLDATRVMGLEIWYNAFMYLKFGYATAAAWIMGSMLIGFTMYQLRILREVRFSTAQEKEV